MIKEFIRRVDEFVLNVVPDHNVGYETKRAMTDALLREAKSMYDEYDEHDDLDLPLRQVLAERIMSLTRMLKRWRDSETDYEHDRLKPLREVVKMFREGSKDWDIGVLEFCKERYFQPAYRRN